MTAEVEPFRGAPEEWDAFALQQRGWTAYHRWAWKPIMERALGHDCSYLAARDGSGRLTGILPLVRVRTLLFGRYLVSMPFLNYGGPLGDADAIEALTAEATALARADRVKLLELRSAVELPVSLPPSHRKITVVLPLTGSADDVWQRLGTKLRAQIKRPQKEGVAVRFGADQVGPFYAVFSRHMRDLGTPVLPRRLFEEIAATFGADAWFGCAWLAERPVAAGCGFRWGTEFEITWASALGELSRVAPNMALYWAFIERAAREGIGRFNFGRCSPDSGTHRFKRQWGGIDEKLWWYQYTPGGGPAATPSPDDAAYAWGPRIWKRLPLALATSLGPRIVRGIP